MRLPIPSHENRELLIDLELNAFSFEVLAESIFKERLTLFILGGAALDRFSFFDFLNLVFRQATQEGKEPFCRILITALFLELTPKQRDLPGELFGFEGVGIAKHFAKWIEDLNGTRIVGKHLFSVLTDDDGLLDSVGAEGY